MQLEIFPTSNTQPLVVCWGKGVDSTAILVGLAARRIRPDLIVFADVGAEREATYDYNIDAWLDSVGFPRPVTVRYQPKNFKHWPPYHTLEENLLTNVTLPSIAYGFHSCSHKWKISPINTFLRGWSPALQCWATGGKVLKAIGFEDSPHERKRAERGCQTFAIQADERDRFELWFPLQQWGWDRQRCQQEIAQAGLPVPPKSSCYFCTAMKTWEVDELTPDKWRRIVLIEARARQRHLDAAEERGWPRGEGVPLTEGLWRRAVLGRRGATPRPGSMTEYIRQKGYLPSEEIDHIIATTPTAPLSAGELGATDWQAWIHNIITPMEKAA